MQNYKKKHYAEKNLQSFSFLIRAANIQKINILKQYFQKKETPHCDVSTLYYQ